MLIKVCFFCVLGVENLREQAELNQELVNDLNLNQLFNCVRKDSITVLSITLTSVFFIQMWFVSYF